MRRLPALCAALLVAAGAPAQDREARGLPGGIALGPRLLDYPMECVAERGCRVECFQSGKTIASHDGIGRQDRIRLMASAGVSDEITPRWIEIRSADSDRVRTLLLSREAFCDLEGLVVSPKNRP